VSETTIVWKAPRPIGSNGMELPAGSGIPVMRPRLKSKCYRRDMIALLEEVQDDLARALCSSSFCDGPMRPGHMCPKCQAIRKVGTVLATLKSQL